MITTDPISGTAVEKGAAVQLIVSSGLPMVTVPDGLVGQAGAEAEAALQALGLVVDSSQAPSSEVAQGLVISAQPAPGTNVAISSTVALVISSGPEMVTVPEVVNQSEADATSALQEAGFAVTATQQHSSSVAQGNVISASPAPGTSVEKGSTVEIVVSAGPEMVTVPNVVNQTQAQAAAALQQAGLAATASQQSSTSVAQGNVISSSPAAGARVEKGSTVQIVVSSGPEMVTVPNVVNKPFDQAQSELQGLGFAVVQSGSDWNVSIPKGAVISSNPGAGQSVVKGSTVQLRVSAGRQPGQITVHNQGAYVARFRVEYTMNGQKVDRSPDFTAGTNQTLGLPSEAENIRVVVEEAVFINTWTTIFAQSFQFPVTKCYVIGGTTLSPNWREC
ncbi:MAG: PASTA domain-containing protein [Caldilineaceae bacterium]|nr:PASTA domain-containing protein [Caldilineaceae bacterium]